MLKKLFFTLPLLLVISCGVQKRKYQNGFYVTWLGHKAGAQAKSSPEKINHVVKPYVGHAVAEKSTEVKTSARVEAKRVSQSDLKKPFLSQPGDSCDRLIFRNGDEKQVIVTLVTGNEVRYNRCGTDGPAYVVLKKDLFMLVHASGAKEVFSTESGTQAQQPKINSGNGGYQSNKPEENEWALYSLISGVAGCLIFVGSIPAIVFGFKALKEMQENPGKYYGRGMAQTGIALGIIKLILFIPALLLLSLLF